MLRIVIFALCTTLMLAAPSRADFLSYDQVGITYARDPERFRSIWKTAETDTIRLGVIGDSQETSPGGAGRIYIPRLQTGFFAHYGNVPETQVASSLSEVEFLHRSGAVGGVASRMAANRLPPTLSAKAHSTLNKSTNVTGDPYGTLVMLQHDAASTADELLRGEAYFDISAGVRAQIFAATNPSSGEVVWRSRPTDGSAGNYFAAQVQTGTSDLGLESLTFAMKSFVTPQLDFAGKQYMQVEVHGSDDAKLTDIAGVRFISGNPRGVVVQDLAGGGYHVDSLLTKHGDSGEMLAAMDLDVFMLHAGVNDIGHGETAAEFKANTLAVIQQIRDWYGDPTLPFILASDPQKSGFTAAQQAEFDQIVGAQYEIAQADPNVMVLNTRLLAQQAGWDDDLATYLSDGVHYSREGARHLAALEIAALLNVPEPCSLAPIGLLLVAILRRRR